MRTVIQVFLSKLDAEEGCIQMVELNSTSTKCTDDLEGKPKLSVIIVATYI